MKKRNTHTKKMVWEILLDSKFALCHEDIEKLLDNKMDRVTLYRILQGFCDDGLVHKIIDTSGKTFYAKCRHCSEHSHHDDHFHFKCTSCERITCMEARFVPQLPENYRVAAVNCVIEGYCPDCAGGDEK